MASINTTPNDSPCRDGAQNTSAAFMRCTFSRSDRRPSHSIRTSPATCARRTSVSGPSLPTQRWTPEGSSPMASSSTARPLRGSWRPRKKMVGSGLAQAVAFAYGSSSTPLKTNSYSPPTARRAMAMASAETAHLRSSLAASQRTIGFSQRYPALSPAAWNVPTSGCDLNSSAVWVTPGARGSCRWTTSKRSSRSALIVRSWADGSGAMGAIEPLAGVGMLSPRGVTPGSGGGPSHGPRTRTSWPSSRSERASPSACPCTPPGRLRLYGETTPIRTSTHRIGRGTGRRPDGGTGMGLADGVERVVVTGPVGLLQVPLLRRGPDELLEARREIDGDPPDVGPEPTLALGRERGLHDGMVPVAALEVAPDGEEARPGAQGEGGRTGREGRDLAEELELHAVAADVPIGEQAHEVACLQRPDHLGGGRRTQRHDVHSELPAEVGEELEQGGGLDRLHDT